MIMTLLGSWLCDPKSASLGETAMASTLVPVSYHLGKCVLLVEGLLTHHRASPQKADVTEKVAGCMGIM